MAENERSETRVDAFLFRFMFISSGRKRKRKETKIFILRRWKIKSVLMACGDEGLVRLRNGGAK